MTVAGAAFRGDSSPEVLLEACTAWGIERAIGRCIGMLAFALRDRRVNRQLHGGRADGLACPAMAALSLRATAAARNAGQCNRNG